MQKIDPQWKKILLKAVGWFEDELTTHDVMERFEEKWWWNGSRSSSRLEKIKSLIKGVKKRPKNVSQTEDLLYIINKYHEHLEKTLNSHPDDSVLEEEKEEIEKIIKKLKR